VSTFKYRAELYDEVWKLAKDAGFENVTMVFDQLAALREELAVANHEIESRISAEVGAIEALQETQQRLADAERRNTELVKLLCGLPAELMELSGCENTAGVIACAEHVNDVVTALTKPEEAKS